MEGGTLNIEAVAETFEAFRRKLNRAIRLTSPDDSRAMQKLGIAMKALAKATATVERLRRDIPS